MAELHEITSTLEDLDARIAAIGTSLGIDAKSKRINEIEQKMAAADFWNDQEAALALVEEMKRNRKVVDPFAELASLVSECRELLAMAVEEEDEDTIAEVEKDTRRAQKAYESLETMALFTGPHDEEDCFFSLQTGAGGSDACEWTEMLLRMYTRYFERKGWKTEELSFHPGEEAGVKNVELRVAGDHAYGLLRAEVGVHRLVRISPFSGRRETSFAAVDVVPDFRKEIEIDIDENDLRIDTYRSSGKGGQHVNKTDSAVRITHLPSGIVVAVQNERSQHRNRDMAMKILKARLHQREEEARRAAADARNAEKKEAAWGSQIRNYVMNPYQLVKDVRTEHQTGDIQAVLDGNLDAFIDAYLRWRAGTPVASK